VSTTDPYGYTAREQAESTLRTILRPDSFGIRDLKGITSTCHRPGEPDTSDPTAWMAWSSLPTSLEARCDVHWLTAANGVKVLDLERMTLELAADIERVRVAFGVPSMALEAA